MRAGGIDVGEQFECVCVCRIRKISGLQALVKLDVLDLHGNMVGVCTVQLV